MSRFCMFDRIVAFEADEFNYRQLIANLLLNDSDGFIEPNFMAISNEVGSASFIPSRSKSDGNRGGVGLGGDSQSVIVNKNKIDNLFDDVGSIFFIKIDVEGHELQVVDGMYNILNRNKCFLQIESFGNEGGLESKLLKMGYKMVESISPDFFFSNIKDYLNKP